MKNTILILAMASRSPLTASMREKYASLLPSKYSGRDADDSVMRCHSLLRHGMNMLGLHGEKVSYRENGMPFLPDYPDIFISLSHTSGAVMCAISSAPVGVDVQQYRQISGRLAESIESESFSLSPQYKISLWCLKESYVKFTGEGISRMKSARFERRGNDIFCLNRPELCCRSWQDIFGCSAAAVSVLPLPEPLLIENEKTLEF